MEIISPSLKYRNIAKVVEVGTDFWDFSESIGLASIVAELKNNKLITKEGHEFINFSCCSYLDLDQHPLIIEGAINALRKYGVLDHCITRARVQIPALCELENSLSDLFMSRVVCTISASVASHGVLPLIASGSLLSGKVRPYMIFDKNCHNSMFDIKPVCADETEIVTCKHHDLNFIEDSLKRYKSVVYVCDGADSLGGYAPISDLQLLQAKYGLYVYYDDSHSISVYGKNGVGFVRSKYDKLDNQTFIVATLNKAFGTSGAVIMAGSGDREKLKIIERFGGAIGYSQPMNTAAIGASMASVEIHKSQELTRLQEELYSKINLFDSLIDTKQKGDSYPIRLISVPDNKVVDVAQKMFAAGFYVSPVFFPVIAKGTAGLRAMLRVGQPDDEIRRFCNLVNNYINE